MGWLEEEKKKKKKKQTPIIWDPSKLMYALMSPRPNLSTFHIILNAYHNNNKTQNDYFPNVVDAQMNKQS